MDYILRPEIAAEWLDYIGYYCTNKAADQLVDENLVVPDSVNKRRKHQKCKRKGRGAV